MKTMKTGSNGTGRLRIAMLSVHSCPLGQLGGKDTGGMSVYICELARELGKLGHRVDVYTRVHDPCDRQTYELGKNARLVHLKAGGHGEVHKVAIYPDMPGFACKLEKFRRQRHLKYDLVFSHYWLSGCVGKYLARWWRVPHIMMFHTLGVMKNATGIGEDEPELRTTTEAELAQDCDYIIAATQGEKEALAQYYGTSPERIGVIPCGVNLDMFHPVDKDEARKRLGLSHIKERIVLFAGRIEPVKGIDQLIRAMTYLPEWDGVRLLIVGGDGQSEDGVAELRALATDLGVAESVTFMGSVKHAEMPYLYSAADVFVLPSYYESFGLVALESLACGTPVVAGDVGDLRNIIVDGETGYVMKDNSPRRLAIGIALTLSGLRSGEESLLLSRASVSRFSWDNIAARFVEECREVLARHSVAVP